MFTRQQIIDEIKGIRAGTLEPEASQVYMTWIDYMLDYLDDQNAFYVVKHGFVGFDAKSIEDIIDDFEFAEMIED